MWGDNAGPEYDWDDKSRMFLPKPYNRGFVTPLQVGTRPPHGSCVTPATVRVFDNGCHAFTHNS